MIGRRSFNYNDLQRARFEHQFTLVGPIGTIGTAEPYLFAITEIQGTGGSLQYIAGGEKYTRTLPSGRVEFFHPIVGELFIFPATITEASGFKMKV